MNNYDKNMLNAVIGSFEEYLASQCASPLGININTDLERLVDTNLELLKNINKGEIMVRYKGKGEHSVNSLEAMIEELKEKYIIQNNKLSSAKHTLETITSIEPTDSLMEMKDVVKAVKAISSSAIERIKND